VGTLTLPTDAAKLCCLAFTQSQNFILDTQGRFFFFFLAALPGFSILRRPMNLHCSFSSLTIAKILLDNECNLRYCGQFQTFLLDTQRRLYNTDTEQNISLTKIDGTPVHNFSQKMKKS
jgi:hypothetical protein